MSTRSPRVRTCPSPTRRRSAWTTRSRSFSRCSTTASACSAPTRSETLDARSNLASSLWNAERQDEAIAVEEQLVRRGRADPRRRPRGRADRAPRPRLVLPRGRAHRRGAGAAGAPRRRPRARPRGRPPGDEGRAARSSTPAADERAAVDLGSAGAAEGRQVAGHGDDADSVPSLVDRPARDARRSAARGRGRRSPAPRGRSSLPGSAISAARRSGSSSPSRSAGVSEPT